MCASVIFSAGIPLWRRVCKMLVHAIGFWGHIHVMHWRNSSLQFGNKVVESSHLDSYHETHTYWSPLFWKLNSRSYNTTDSVILQLILWFPLKSQSVCISLCRVFFSTAAEVKFYSDQTIVNTNLATSKLHEISRYDVLSDIGTGSCVYLSLCYDNQKFVVINQQNPVKRVCIMNR